MDSNSHEQHLEQTHRIQRDRTRIKSLLFLFPKEIGSGQKSLPVEELMVDSKKVEKEYDPNKGKFQQCRCEGTIVGPPRTLQDYETW